MGGGNHPGEPPNLQEPQKGKKKGEDGDEKPTPEELPNTPDTTQPTQQKLITEYFHSQEAISDQASETPPAQSETPPGEGPEETEEEVKSKKTTYMKIAQRALGRDREADGPTKQ